jgi:hypothetical protein
LIQLLLHNQIEDLIRPLRDNHADIDVRHAEYRFCILLVELEGIFLAAVWVDEEQQLPRSFDGWREKKI